MLDELRIEDYALIDELEIEFGPGLNVLTGETGAGKSIVIDAVSAVLGERASSSEVRQGTDRALIEAAFTIERESEAAKVLRGLDLWQDDDVLIISREIARAGRSKCRINGRLANLSHLHEVGKSLIDIHGQHDHQSLLSTSRHLDLLDAMGDSRLAGLRREVADLAQRRSRLLSEIERLKEGERDRARREDLLRFQIEEIRGARLEPGEDERLASERDRLAHAEKLAEGVREAYGFLYEGEAQGGASAVDLIGSAVHRLEHLEAYDESLSTVVEPVRQSLIALQEASRDLRSYAEGLMADPGRLQEIEERLETIARMKRKYGETVEEILAFCDDAERALDELVGAEDRLERLASELERTDEELGKKAAALSAERRRLAERIAEAIVGRLAALNMPDARFEVAFSVERDPDGVLIDGARVGVTVRGIDKVEFLFSANPGEDPRPLAKIASGGEMSRVMLAIKSTMAEADPASTLIFDEVDAGIGGRTAESVAQALAELAETHQVLVVTHLAQIAARADRHFVVEKSASDGRTTVVVRQVDEEERAWEVARMLDGKATATSYEHAKALLDLARKTRSAS